MAYWYEAETPADKEKKLEMQAEREASEREMGLCREIAEHLAQRREESGLSIERVYEMFAEETGVTFSSAKSMSSYFTQGPYGMLSSNRRYQLAKASLLFEIIGVEEEDRVVNLMRAFDSGFVYPPTGEVREVYQNRRSHSTRGENHWTRRK